jgi:hypothetical protein
VLCVIMGVVLGFFFFNFFFLVKDDVCEISNGICEKVFMSL